MQRLGNKVEARTIAIEAGKKGICATSYCAYIGVAELSSITLSKAQHHRCDVVKRLFFAWAPGPVT